MKSPVVVAAGGGALLVLAWGVGQHPHDWDIWSGGRCWSHLWVVSGFGIQWWVWLLFLELALKSAHSC